MDDLTTAYCMAYMAGYDSYTDKETGVYHRMNPYWGQIGYKLPSYYLNFNDLWRTESDIYNDKQNEKTMETLTKEQALQKIDELKSYVENLDKPKEKTWERYIWEYTQSWIKNSLIYNALCTKSPINYMPEFKYGLLKFIADDLNGGGDKEYTIRVEGGVVNKSMVLNYYIDRIFTSDGAEKAAKIIPPKFLKSF
jgi:hypothetical protein